MEEQTTGKQLINTETRQAWANTRYRVAMTWKGMGTVKLRTVRYVPEINDAKKRVMRLEGAFSRIIQTATSSPSRKRMVTLERCLGRLHRQLTSLTFAVGISLSEPEYSAHPIALLWNRWEDLATQLNRWIDEYFERACSSLGEECFANRPICNGCRQQAAGERRADRGTDSTYPLFKENR